MKKFISNSTVSTKAILSLSRWREHIFFALPLSLLGYLLVGDAAKPDLRLAAGVVANLLCMSFAFMVNDVEDADDDQASDASKTRNPVSAKRITKTDAYFLTAFVCISAAILYLSLSVYKGSFGFGLLILLLSGFYSLKPIRIKAYPVVDVISHSLMLGGLLPAYIYSLYSSDFSQAVLPIAGVTLVSAYGQLYNQVRDFEADKLAGLHNSAILIGAKQALVLAYCFVAMGTLLMVISFVVGIVPLWVLGIAVVAYFVSGRLVSGSDARGTRAIDKTGSQQNRIMFVLNTAIAVWFVISLVS